jgi:hypothetical protein
MDAVGTGDWGNEELGTQERRNWTELGTQELKKASFPGFLIS